LSVRYFFLYFIFRVEAGACRQGRGEGGPIYLRNVHMPSAA
jgi:hypothetical protein